MAHVIKNLPTVQKTWLQPLSQKNPVVKGMTARASILPYLSLKIKKS